jgi:streptogramin lyase
VDQSGNVFVADTGNHRIEKFTSTGTFLLQWGSMGSANGQFHSPEGVAVDGAGNVFVTDLNNNRIDKFDNDGTFLTSWGDAGNGDGQFSGPVGVAVDATGNVFVADRFNNRIQKFTNTGTFLTKWGTVGDGDGQFANPVGVAVDRNLNVFVADFFNDRIQKFTDTGTFLTKWGSTGSGKAQFIGARAVAVDGSANVFAVDGGNERIEVFTDTGTFLTTWGSPGTHDGQFNSATAVAVDANAEVLILDESNRVQRFACSPPIDEAALAASTRVATESILRLFDLQASVGTAASVAGRARAATGGAAGVSGCQQLDCSLFGTQEICCSDTQFSQFFDNCSFHDDLGRVVSLNGLFDLVSDTADVCTGAIPVGASFAASLQNFTQDVFFPDGSFSRTFQELNETFEVVPGGCTVSQPDQFGFGIRGDGRRFINGEVQHFQGDGLGNIPVDSASDVHALGIAVGSTQEPDGCAVAATLNGTLIGADFRVGTQFKTEFTDFHVGQLSQAGALVLGLNGTVGTDCLGAVTLSTVEPLRVASGDPCFTAGRLEAQLADGTVSVTYTARGGSDLDFGAGGSVDQHFVTCTDVPADQCSTTVVGLCGACTALNQCQGGLACVPCSADCSGDTRRCSLSDTFVTCEDGVF